MQCYLMSMVVYALGDVRIVLWLLIITNKSSDNFGFVFQSVSAKQSFQEAADALFFNARGAIKLGKISHMICDTFEIYRVVLLSCVMESRTASISYHVFFAVDPTITSWYFSSHSAVEVFHE